jgi:hypothetical protein
LIKYSDPEKFSAYSTFREWNPDPEIADTAEKLYGHIDDLELYVGLQAEESKPVVDGASPYSKGVVLTDTMAI